MRERSLARVDAQHLTRHARRPLDAQLLLGCRRDQVRPHLLHALHLRRRLRDADVLLLLGASLIRLLCDGGRLELWRLALMPAYQWATVSAKVHASIAQVTRRTLEPGHRAAATQGSRSFVVRAKTRAL